MQIKSILKLVLIMLLILCFAIAIGLFANQIITEEIPFPYKNGIERTRAKITPLIDRVNDLRATPQTSIQISNYDPNYRIQPEDRYACHNYFSGKLLLDSIKLIMTSSDCDPEYIDYEIGYKYGSSNYYIDRNGTYADGLLYNKIGNILADPAILYELYYQPPYILNELTLENIGDTSGAQFYFEIFRKTNTDKKVGPYEFTIFRNDIEDTSSWDKSKFAEAGITETWDFTNNDKIKGVLSKGESIIFILEFTDL